MTVYEVCYGYNREEGVAVQAVYSTIEAALEYARARVVERVHCKELRDRRIRREHPDFSGDTDRWTQEQPGTWSDGTQIVLVMAREVDDPKPLASIDDEIRRADEDEETNK